jgi:hypothetical protein
MPEDSEVQQGRGAHHLTPLVNMPQPQPEKNAVDADNDQEESTQADEDVVVGAFTQVQIIGGKFAGKVAYIQGTAHADKALDPAAEYEVMLEELDKDGDPIEEELLGAHLEYGHGNGKSIARSDLDTLSDLEREQGEEEKPELCLNGARFSGIFQGDINFKERELKWVSFSGVTFSGVASFSSATFSGVADYQRGHVLWCSIFQECHVLWCSQFHRCHVLWSSIFQRCHVL